MSGKFTQSAINLMNALLYSWNQQPQAWDESLKMFCNILIRFNIQFLQIIGTTTQVLSML